MDQPSSPTQVAAGVLASSEIRRRLDGGEIFRRDTWDPQMIRAAAYDIRVASDFLIVPDGVGGLKKYARDQHRKNLITLHPGDVALLSTLERLCMPWDLTANLGIKFGYARRGLMILSGLLVDPGFGLTRTPSGAWEPAEDERLHFLVANVSVSPIQIQPGDPIAALQFLPLVGTPDREVVTSRERLDTMFFHPDGEHHLGFAFFTAMAEVNERVERLEELSGAVERSTDQLQEYERRLAKTESATQTVVLFGVYLLGVTILGVALATILSILSGESWAVISGRAEEFLGLLPGTWPRVTGLGMVLSFVLALVWLTSRRPRRGRRHAA